MRTHFTTEDDYFELPVQISQFLSILYTVHGVS